MSPFARHYLLMLFSIVNFVLLAVNVWWSHQLERGARRGYHVEPDHFVDLSAGSERPAIYHLTPAGTWEPCQPVAGPVAAITHTPPDSNWVRCANFHLWSRRERGDYR